MCAKPPTGAHRLRFISITIPPTRISPGSRKSPGWVGCTLSPLFLSPALIELPAPVRIPHQVSEHIIVKHCWIGLISYPKDFILVMQMENQEHNGCSPDSCDSCTGCGGQIEKISLRVEWRHKREKNDQVGEIEESIHTLARDLAISNVELTFVNNNFSPDITEGTSEFFINGHPLETLTSIPSDGLVTKDTLRKGIFQALLQNV
ncbi:MAG: hypothetical protein CVV33_05270 [Methanomicrobiales archaeon HGW-Methanomicrobiales-4]|nr:MAG: hypothetical protein CVV33_05270 [Methanomicrobiales archaeon HGW-Methanomicrobiales-4]